ncbi:aldo/keto reductase [Deinococcus malanensis]|uniref:aldo/keto reductase n=1 Tax=Deinococcus malanensis TaxID=1706855 RepID=UPI00362DADDA
MGRWMKARGNRDQMVVATKVRGPMGPRGSEGRGTIHQREGLSRRWILKACEDSLRRMQVDHIDLYQAHWVDNQTPIEETLAAFTELVQRGYVRYIGCSNYSAWRLMQALWASDRHGLESYVSIQPEYSLLSPPAQTSSASSSVWPWSTAWEWCPGARWAGNADRQVPARSAPARQCACQRECRAALQ